MLINMKTIAITVDEDTLRRVDHLLSGKGAWKGRSALARQALRAFLDDLERRSEEEREREVWRRHRKGIRRQAAALVRDQASP